ncbi:MAG: hypothetical protein Q8R31_03855, partial [Candidatus Omnitrophota bacterium]|nr:hypothetical protein [Candidatus Omnitrophota bacterium]
MPPVCVHRKAVLISLLTLFVSVLVPTTINAQFEKPVKSLEEAPKTIQYAPGEVLVKFKEGAEPQSVLQTVNLESKSMERIYSIKPAVTKFKKDSKLEKDSKGWYWFLGKKYKEVAEIPDEEVFQEAYKQMPEEEKSLYRTYKIDLPEGVSIEQAMVELKKDPDVEYVQPNYLMKTYMVPNDPYYSSSGSWGQTYDDLWGLKPDKLNCAAAWDISQGEGVVVGVI